MIGHTKHGEAIWYSKPSLSEERRFTEETMKNYLIHLDEAAKQPYVWIFDSAGLDKLEMPNLMLMRKFYNEIKIRYRDVLKKQYVLNIGWKVNTLFNMLLPFLSEEAKRRIVNCKGPMELLADGIPAEIVMKVYHSSSESSTYPRR
jgi:hypothetical protein